VSSDERFSRALIYLQALGTAIAYILAVTIVDAFYVARHVSDPGMAFGYAFCLVQGGIIGFLLALSVVIKLVRHRGDRRWARWQPVILAHASAHLAGTDATTELRKIQKRHPREVERCVAELLLRVQGGARRSLSIVATELNLVERWQEQYRSISSSRRLEAVSRMGRLDGEAATPTLIRALADSEDEIKLEASRSLIRANAPKTLLAVFRAAVRESLLVRAVLAEALRPHAAWLCESAVPEALAGSDPKTVRTALEMVRAWGKSLPMPPVRPALAHENAGVRAAALAVLPQLAAPREYEPEILRALSDDDERVRAAAADVAGRLRLVAAIPALQACLEAGGPESTVAAAYALARLGGEGWHALERESLHPRRETASAALEALEQARSDRLLVSAL
jgi:HEAT repeat protein